MTTSNVDFFVSYTGLDTAWAEWIAVTLESAGYTTVSQVLDFEVGDNFVLLMERALTRSSRVILVLSPAYMKSAFTAAEWSAAFREDPDGSKGRLLPVMIQDFPLDGLLGPRIYIPLFGLEEAQARDRLLSGLEARRRGRTAPPPFPGGPK